MRTSLVRSVRGAWDASAARFGQTRALANARHAATGMSRQRVDREDVRLFLEGLDQPEPDQTDDPRSRPPRRAAAGSDS